MYSQYKAGYFCCKLAMNSHMMPLVVSSSNSNSQYKLEEKMALDTDESIKVQRVDADSN
jgi:hypothetical protein